MSEEPEPEKKPKKPKPSPKPKIIWDAKRIPTGISVHYEFDTGEAGSITFGYPFTKRTIEETLKRLYKERSEIQKLDVKKLKGIIRKVE